MAGIPYTLEEAKLVVAIQTMDPYHREIMQFLICEIERMRANRRCPPGFFCTHDLPCPGAVR